MAKGSELKECVYGGCGGGWGGGGGGRVGDFE